MRTSLKTAVSVGLLASGVVAQNRQGRLPELPPPKLYRLEELQHVARANVIAILGGTLVDGTGVPPLAKSAIVVRGNRIVQVTTMYYGQPMPNRAPTSSDYLSSPLLETGPLSQRQACEHKRSG